MATLWKRATPTQYRMLRAIAGAVMNAAHAHSLDVSKNFARSVAKRATGTLTAQWPEVLAATANRRQEGSRDSSKSRPPRGGHSKNGLSEGDRLRLLRRSPIRTAWKCLKMEMWQVKHGDPDIRAAYVRALRLLDEAQRGIDEATTPAVTSNNRETT